MSRGWWTSFVTATQRQQHQDAERSISTIAGLRARKARLVRRLGGWMRPRTRVQHVRACAGQARRAGDAPDSRGPAI